MFNALYEPLLNNLATHVQQLPDPNAPEHRLLDRRLRHAECALARRRGYFLPMGASPERMAREADVWTYAVFSAALIRRLDPDLGRIVLTLYTTDQRPLPVTRLGWTGLQTVGACGYEVRDIQPSRTGFDATLLHVACLMPRAGVAWLWREPTVLSAWLQACREPTPPAVWGELLAEPPSTPLIR